MSNKSIKKIVISSMFLALAVVFHYIESLIPLPVPMPGFKLGLANIVSTIALFYLGPVYYIFISILRVLLVALISSSGFGTAFLLSIGGMTLAMITTLLLYFISKKNSIFGISAMSAIMHVFGQVSVYSWLTLTPYIFIYFPVLATLSFVSSILLAIIGRQVLISLPNIENLRSN